jgi:Zn-finger nucleic acid-binding protein
MSDNTPNSATGLPQIGMPCPRCRVDLMMTERQGVEIDYCPKCRGVWLDRGELDKIIERNAQYTTAAPPEGPAPAPMAQSPWAAAPGVAPPGAQPGVPPPGWGQGYDQGYGGHGGHGGHGGGHGGGQYGGRGHNSFLGRLFG